MEEGINRHAARERKGGRGAGPPSTGAGQDPRDFHPPSSRQAPRGVQAFLESRSRRSPHSGTFSGLRGRVSQFKISKREQRPVSPRDAHAGAQRPPRRPLVLEAPPCALCSASPSVPEDVT